MLSAIGVSSLDGLFEQIPSTVRLDGPLGLPEGVSELEIVEEMGRLTVETTASTRAAESLLKAPPA